MNGKFLDLAEKIMNDFASQTGIVGGGKPRRYLWTDAFAVCNFLGLYLRRGDEKYRRLALKLVDQVHFVLGRHREDDSRRGWISGLSEEEGWKHPTIGGLRIGKRLPERKPSEPFDELLEWERDGQYYHYLTRWMHALNRVSQVTGNPTYNLWAIELAKTAHKAFIYETPDGRKRMYWKMSIDLSRPLVASMGQHDPLDGFVTYNELQASAPNNPDWPNLLREIGEIEELCREISWMTNDPLAVGGLLWSSYFLAKLIADGHLKCTDILIEAVNASLLGLELYLASGATRLPATRRLAFRELGLSIGFKAARKLKRLIAAKPSLFSEGELPLLVRSLISYAWLADEIEGFWLNPANRKSGLWREHEGINMVMLATSLVPEGFLGT
ncbi:hypothetical protein J7L29_05590 [Candidatus Bathyarchaeota archaeon]|nr:hypothetical protein [Candidatus Bathyarchaeota archaeon]